jgi:hypothetical protein
VPIPQPIAEPIAQPIPQRIAQPIAKPVPTPIAQPIAPDPIPSSEFYAVLREWESKPVDKPVVKPAKAGTLSRVWSWLTRNYSVAQKKRMRVAESIPLGEKRFVALLTVDGREFLIGGGSSGVSLLSQWNSSTESPASGMQKFGSRESLE